MNSRLIRLRHIILALLPIFVLIGCTSYQMSESIYEENTRTGVVIQRHHCEGVCPEEMYDYC